MPHESSCNITTKPPPPPLPPLSPLSTPYSPVLNSGKRCITALGDFATKRVKPPLPDYSLTTIHPESFFHFLLKVGRNYSKAARFRQLG